MFRNYLKTAFRKIARNRLFASLNIFGLAAGLTCFILIFIWIQGEINFDKFNPGAERIFRLTGKVKGIETAAVPSAFAAAIKSAIPGIKNATRISSQQLIITIGTNKFDEKRIYYADSNFLLMFNYPLLLGNISTVLLAPNSVVLTEATAIKYFGNAEQAMGKAISSDSSIWQVTGVLKNIPRNSHLQFDLLLAIQNNNDQWSQSDAWRYFSDYVYFQMADGLKPKPAVVEGVERQINAIRNTAILNTKAVPASFSAQPLLDIHLRSHFSSDINGQGNIQYVQIFALVALFIILIACINFMNLATALSGTRAKEVGLRKTVGALRWQLTLQFIVEAMLLAFISLGVAMLLAFAALPFFNTLASKSLSLDLLDIKLTGEILGIATLVGLLAGSYPALYFSSFTVIKVLKSGQILRGKNSFLRNGLVVLQFSISIILIIGTVVINTQVRYLHDRDIGFNRQNLLYVPLPEVGDLKNNAEALKSELIRSSQIGDYTFTNNLPTNMNSARPLAWRGMEKGSLVICQRLNADENFIKTFRMKMLAGRFYSKEFKGSDSDYVVNESTVRAMKMDPATALGKMIRVRDQEGPIIGVVKDFNFKPAYQPIEPLVIRHRSFGEFLVVRTANGKMQRTLGSVQSCFQRVYGNNPFSYGFIDQDLDQLYRAEIRMGSLFNIFSVLSIMISCLGLFGLASFEAQRRTKEIGVRKVLGASKSGIVVLLAKEFLKLVVLSMLIAFPIAWGATRQWLQGYTYRISINWWVFVSAGLLALLIAFLTVSYQTIGAARANPVRSLRNE